tara:strand:- start:76137 stop:76499 length:363 start_codon:yes stop_codon:yes gene_type:complete
MRLSRNFLSWIYLAFAISGALFPTLANIEFIKIYGPTFDISNFIYLANINPAAQSLSRDLFIGAGAVTVWIFVEAKRLKMKNLWVVISSFLIAFAFAAPLFLFLRERRLIEIEEKNNNID